MGMAITDLIHYTKINIVHIIRVYLQNEHNLACCLEKSIRCLCYNGDVMRFVTARRG